MSALKQIPTPPDLAGPVFYRRAALGYPHIQAPDRVSGSYALGCLHALDRPVQVHLSLLAAEGRLMEFLGNEPVARAIDRSIRFFNFRADAEEQAAALNRESRELIDGYCRGFNDTRARRRRPLLLRLLGVPAAELSPVSTIVMFRLLAYFGLTSLQHTAEMVVAELVARGAPRPLFDFLLGDAAAGLDLESLQGLAFPPELSFLRLPHAAGSNAFAVSGKRSATGGALLMGEFHMQSGRFPPVLYAAHIEYPNGEYYQGVGLPGLCFLAAGRTSRVAWSYTYGHADNVDVLVEECRGGQYRAGDVWKPLTRRVERIPVRGRTPEEWVYFENEYGTTTGAAASAGDGIRDGRHPFVRWAGLRESASDLNGVLGKSLPSSAEELAERHRSAKTLSLGAVIADSGGRIAYVQTGRIDERPAGWTGAYPRRGWDLPSRQPAALAEDARPFVVDPEEGFVVSANEFNRGQHGEWWSTLPEPIYRWERLRQILGATAKPDMNTLVRASYDPVDFCAQRLMAVWKPLLPDDLLNDADARALADWAAQQQANLTRAGQQSAQRTESDRRMVGLFHALHYEMVLALLLRWLPPKSVEEIVDAASGILLFQYHIDQALALGRPDLLDEATLRGILAAAWPAARKRASLPGWGVPARFAFVNEYFRGKLPRRMGFDTAVVEPPGGPTVPFQLREVAFAGMKLYFAPAFHMVFDMSRPGGWFHIPGGASERRLGPGYGKGVDEWLTGQFFPLGPAAGPAPRWTEYHRRAATQSRSDAPRARVVPHAFLFLPSNNRTDSMNYRAILLAAVAFGLLVPAAVQGGEPAHFHHVRLNVRDVSKSMRFYQRFFGAVPVKYRGNPDALFVERSFLLFNAVDSPPEDALNTGIWHIGWGGVDMRAEYEWYRKHGAQIHTPLSPLPGPDNYYFYQQGPDKELIEINTMGHHRFAHVHLFATDVNATCRWYRDHLGLKPRLGERSKPAGNMATLDKIWMNFMQCDNVLLIVFGKPDVTPPPPWWPEAPLKTLQPTKGRPIDHLAFSYRKIEPVFEAMQHSGVKIAETIKVDPNYHFKSFFAEGPDGVLLEIIEEKPVPEGIWD